MQKQFAALLLILTLGMVTVLKAGVQRVQPAQTTDISGPWVLSAVVLGEPLASRLIFKMDGEKLTGTGFGDLLIRGTLREANQLEFWLWTQSGRPIAAFKGTIENGKQSGTIIFNGQPGTWTAQRPAARPPDASRFHTFEPNRFHRATAHSPSTSKVAMITASCSCSRLPASAAAADHCSGRSGARPAAEPKRQVLI